MRYLLFFFIPILTGCSGQSTTGQPSKIDTVKLFNPNGHPDNAGAKDMNMFKRAIAVVKDGYAIILNDKETDFENLSEVESFVISNADEIKKDLFYILMVSTRDFNITMSLIDILTKNQITDYKVINVEQHFTPSEPVTIEAPTSVVTSLDENDSTYFSITIIDPGINVNLFGQKTKLKTTNGLDSFVTAHKSDIKKILIITTKDVPNKSFQAVLEVLKKHKFYKYNLVTK